MLIGGTVSVVVPVHVSLVDFRVRDQKIETWRPGRNPSPASLLISPVAIDELATLRLFY